MDCVEVRCLLLASLHGELDAELVAQIHEHLAGCSVCSASSRLERRFEERLRGIQNVPASPALRSRIERDLSAAPRVVPPRIRRLAPVFWVSAGALAACAVIFLGLPMRGPSRSSQSQELVGTMVCLGCLLRPETVSRHAADRGLDHLNGLRGTDGRLWHLMDTGERHDWLVSDALLSHQVKLRGVVDPASRSIFIDALTVLEPEHARLRLPRRLGDFLLAELVGARRCAQLAMAPVECQLESEFLPDPCGRLVVRHVRHL